jgi:hypothetical protein
LPGYSSFRAAKADLGSAGPGKVYDPCGGTITDRAQRVRPEKVHNPFNLNPVLRGINQLKANYYPSIRPFTGGITV